MNELQKIEFELLRCFQAICEKLELPYFLVCGSALGAARHGGFIPWDDDLDIGMYRDDYNKFVELAPSILPDGIFLQNYNSDPQFPAIYAKLRNSNTTYIEKTVAGLDINHGIYIDIFPLDGYPKTKFEQKKLSYLKKYYALKLQCGFPQNTWRRRIISLMFRFFGCHRRTNKTAQKYEALLSRYPVDNSSLICNHGTWYGIKDYISADRYGDGATLTFEGIKVRVPSKCEEYLSDLYGDWREKPPLEKQIGHHYYEVCDTKNSYSTYI